MHKSFPKIFKQTENTEGDEGTVTEGIKSIGILGFLCDVIKFSNLNYYQVMEMPIYDYLTIKVLQILRYEEEQRQSNNRQGKAIKRY